MFDSMYFLVAPTPFGQMYLLSIAVNGMSVFDIDDIMESFRAIKRTSFGSHKERN